MKKYLFNFMMCFLSIMGFYSSSASEKVNLSDFLTEKDQKPQKSYPYYSTYQHQYLGVDLDEDLAIFSNTPEKNQVIQKMYPYHSRYQRQYLGVDLDEDLAIFSNTPEKNQVIQKMYPYHSRYQRQYLGVDLDEDLAIFQKVPYNKQNILNKIVNGTFNLLKKLKK